MPAVPEWPGGFRDLKWVPVDGVFWGGGREIMSHLTELDPFFHRDAISSSLPRDLQVR